MTLPWDPPTEDALAPDRWTIRTALGHVEAVGDPLGELIDVPQELPALG